MLFFYFDLYEILIEKNIGKIRKPKIQSGTRKATDSSFSQNFESPSEKKQKNVFWFLQDKSATGVATFFCENR